MNLLKLSLRQHLKNPGFAIVAILTLALGIGANTAVFTVANTVLLKPLPFPASERVMSLWETNPQRGFPQAPVAFGQFTDWRQNLKSFSSLAAWQGAVFNLGAEQGGVPERRQGAQVTEDFFRVVATPPLMGGFSPEHFQPGKNGVVIISHGLWRDRFGSDPAIIGRSVVINGTSRTVVGVMPEKFQTPAKADFWSPFLPAPGQAEDRNWKALLVFGRLAQGATPEFARTELEGFHASLQQAYPEYLRDWGATLFPVLETVAKPLRPAMLVLVAGVGLVLLMACVNVANLLLARGSGRAAEFAVRSALGAGRRDLIRQLLTESLLLAAVGGVAGVVVAHWLLGALLAAAPASIPRLDQVRIDGPALLFSLGICALTGVLFGLFPALQLSKARPIDALRSGGRMSVPLGRLKRALVAAQVATAVVVLCATGLFVRSFERLLNADLGFQPERLLTARIDLPSARYSAERGRDRFVDELIGRLSSQTGIESVAAAAALPLQSFPQYTMRIEGVPSPEPGRAPVTGYTAVSTDYFATLKHPIRNGRDFNAGDHENAPRVCIVNEAFARRHFSGTDVLGKRITITLTEPSDWLEIVGVAGNTRNAQLEGETVEQAFVPMHQENEIHRGNAAISVAIRTTGDPSVAADVLTKAVWSIDRNQPVHRVLPMTTILGENWAQRRFTTLVMSVFAVVAALLAGIGLYGVMSHFVQARTRELGIRMALGAQRGDLVRLVLANGGRTIAAGVAVGLAGAVAAAWAVRSMLYRTPPFDVSTFAGVMLFLIVTGLAACWWPARRATKVDPMHALRAE